MDLAEMTRDMTRDEIHEYVQSCRERAMLTGKPIITSLQSSAALPPLNVAIEAGDIRPGRSYMSPGLRELQSRGRALRERDNLPDLTVDFETRGLDVANVDYGEIERRMMAAYSGTSQVAPAPQSMSLQTVTDAIRRLAELSVPPPMVVRTADLPPGVDMMIIDKENPANSVSVRAEPKPKPKRLLNLCDE